MDMKKKFFLILACFAVMFLSLGLVACGEKEVPTYKITVDDAIQHGSVNVLGSAKAGETVYVETVADDGWAGYSITYNFHEVLLDTHGRGHFVMPGRDVKISATFRELRTINTTAENGFIEITSHPTKKAVFEQNVEGKVTCNSGFSVKSLKANDQPITVGTNGTFSFVMPDEDVNLVAEFAKLHRVEVGATTNGTLKLRCNGILGSSFSLIEGNEVEVVPTPSESYYKVGEVKYTTGSQETILQSPYRFTMPEGDVVVTATFVDMRKNIILGDVQNGSIQITSHTNMKAVPGETVRGIVITDDTYDIQDVKVNSQSVQLNKETGEFSFTMPDGDATVEATIVEHVYEADGLYICTSANFQEEYYKNNFLYFHDGKVDIGIVSDYEYFVGKDYGYTLNKNEIEVELGDVDDGISHSQKILKNGNIEIEIEFGEEMGTIVYTFEKYLGEEIVLQNGEYSTTMGTENFQTVLESNGNLFIIDSEDEKGRDLGEVSFYGDLIIIKGYDQKQQIVGKLTKTQDNSYNIDAVIYYYVSGYYDNVWHDGYLSVEDRPISLTRVGDFNASEEKLYVIQSVSSGELADFQKQSFVVFKGEFVTVGIQIYEDFFKGFYYRQYIPYTTAENGKIKVELRFDGTEYTLKMEATIEDTELKFDFNEAQYVFKLDTNSQSVESGVEYKLGGYVDPYYPEDPIERDWLFMYNSERLEINIFYYDNDYNGDRYKWWGAYQYNRVKVFGDKFICFNEELINNIVVGTISNLEGAIQLHGCEYQGEVEHFVFTWTLTK